MSEPDGLNMSLDDLIKKRTPFGRGGGGPANRGGGRSGGGLGIRDGGVNKFGDRKQFSPKSGSEQTGQQRPQHSGQPQRGGFGGRGGGGFQQRRGGFGGRMGGGRHHFDGARGEAPAPPAFRESKVQTYLDDATGNVVVKLADTEVVTVSPSGVIVLSSGGWFTQSTLEVMNKALGVLQIHVKVDGDIRDGVWWVRYGPHVIRFRDGVTLHPKNPAAAAQRAPIVLAAMTGATPQPAAPVAPAAAAMFGGQAAGAFGAPAAGLFLQPVAAPTGFGGLSGGAAALGGAAGLGAAGLGAAGLGAGAAAPANQLGNAAAAASAALVLARARAAFGLGGGAAAGAAAPPPSAAQASAAAVAAQQQYALAALAQNPALLAGLVEQAAAADPDALRRLKAQGRA